MAYTRNDAVYARANRKHQIVLGFELKRIQVERKMRERYFAFEKSVITTRHEKLVNKQKELGLLRPQTSPERALKDASIFLTDVPMETKVGAKLPPVIARRQTLPNEHGKIPWKLKEVLGKKAGKGKDDLPSYLKRKQVSIEASSKLRKSKLGNLGPNQLKPHKDRMKMRCEEGKERVGLTSNPENDLVLENKMEIRRKDLPTGSRKEGNRTLDSKMENVEMGKLEKSLESKPDETLSDPKTETGKYRTEKPEDNPNVNSFSAAAKTSDANESTSQKSDTTDTVVSEASKCKSAKATARKQLSTDAKDTYTNRRAKSVMSNYKELNTANTKAFSVGLRPQSAGVTVA